MCVCVCACTHVCTKSTTVYAGACCCIYVHVCTCLLCADLQKAKNMKGINILVLQPQTRVNLQLHVIVLVSVITSEEMGRQISGCP